MQPIRYFKQNTLDELRAKVRKNLSWYREEEDANDIDIIDNYANMSKKMDSECWDQLNQNPTENDDLQNVIAVYEGLKLSLQQAAEERIWAYATHAVAGTYTAKRWNKIPKDDDNASKYILAHYFVSGPRGLIRDNAVARLWWMGHIASRCKDYSLEETLRILLKNSDVRANLLERSSVSMSPEMFSGVIRVLGRSLADSENPKIYERKNFRSLMKMLNQRGGRIMLNTLKPEQLDDVLDSMVEQVTQGGDG